MTNIPLISQQMESDKGRASETNQQLPRHQTLVSSNLTKKEERDEYSCNNKWTEGKEILEIK